MAAGVYGHELSGDLPLARLRHGELPRGRITLRRSDGPLLDEPAEILSVVEDQDGRGFAFATARAGDTLRCWCVASGGYLVDPATGLILAEGTGDPAATEDRLLNALIPLLLLARGELVLHGAAVHTRAGALLVCGPSRRGKSTLAAVLGAQGVPVLAEDALVVTQDDTAAWLWPGPVGVRLDPTTARALAAPLEAGPSTRGKHTHLPAGEAIAHRVPVAAIACLEPRSGAEPRLRRIDGPAALARLFPNVFGIELDAQPRAFAAAGELVRRVPVLAARMPDGLERLPAAARRLAAAAGDVAETAAPTRPLRAA